MTFGKALQYLRKCQDSTPRIRGRTGLTPGVRLVILLSREPRMSYLRTIGLQLIAGCSLALLGQNAPPPQGSLDPAQYESFFRQVSQLNSTQVPLLERALGMRTDEAQALSGIANDCETRSVAFTKEIREVFLCIRLAALAEEAPQESAVRRYGELNRERAQMVLDHIQAMKTLLGEARFQRIENAAGSGNGNWGSFLGLPPAPRNVKAVAAARQAR